MMCFHSAGSTGVIESRLPRCRTRIFASALWRRSSSSVTSRVFAMKRTSTLTQRGLSRADAES